MVRIGASWRAFPSVGYSYSFRRPLWVRFLMTDVITLGYERLSLGNVSCYLLISPLTLI